MRASICSHGQTIVLYQQQECAKPYLHQLTRTESGNPERVTDKIGRKGRESTYHKVAGRYYWEGCYQDTKSFVASCEKCQHHDPKRMEDALHLTWSSRMWV